MAARLGITLDFPSGAGYFGLMSTLTELVALASWHFVERPISTLKRYFP